MTPFLLVLSSPSGVGKTTIARQLLERRADVGYSVSATTRAPRPGEEHGRSYWFLSEVEFEAEVQAGAFVEHARYNANRYGTLKREVERLFALGKHVVMDIEVEGARQVRRQVAEAVFVFILPPSGAELVKRLGGRGTETSTVLKHRLAIANDELKAVTEYDYVVVNDDLERAIAQVAAILDAEGHRVSRHRGLAQQVEQIRREVAAAAMRLD